VRRVRLAVALVAGAAAAFAALLAADVRDRREAITRGDAQYAQHPAAADWGAAPMLPFDPALRVLGVSDDLALRRAARRFVAVRASGNGIDNGFSEAQARGALEAVLTRLAAGADRVRDADADNLLGILAFADSRRRGPNVPAPVDRSVADFEAAVALDPANAAAKFNLELLLRDLAAKGTRRGPGTSSAGPGKGHTGAGAGVPGRGY
jgi:hypothetical protein